MTKRIGYTIIGGYLGAGKTTLLNNLLRNSQGLRLAIMVNDFGDINIDADLVVSHDGETIQLASGCICCSLADGFLMALNQVSKRVGQIDHIVVEASGVSDPVKVGQYGAILKLDLHGVIVLVDAEQIQDKATNKYVGETVIRQLRGADLLVLNKVDLVLPKQLASVRAWLAEVAPGAHIIEASYGQVPLPILLGEYVDEERERAMALVVMNEFLDGQHEDGVRERDEHEHQALYRTWTLSSQEPMSEADLRAQMDSLPESVVRAKGFVYLAEDPEHRYVLQHVGKRWTLTREEPWGDRKAATRVVIIGVRELQTVAH